MSFCVPIIFRNNSHTDASSAFLVRLSCILSILLQWGEKLTFSALISPLWLSLAKEVYNFSTNLNLQVLPVSGQQPVLYKIQRGLLCCSWDHRVNPEIHDWQGKCMCKVCLFHSGNSDRHFFYAVMQKYGSIFVLIVCFFFFHVAK